MASKGMQRNHRAGALLRRMKAEFGDEFDPVIEALRHSRKLAVGDDGEPLEAEFDDEGNATFKPDHDLYVQTLMQAAGFVFPKLKAVEVDTGEQLRELLIEMRGVAPKDGSEHEAVVIDMNRRLTAGGED